MRYETISKILALFIIISLVFLFLVTITVYYPTEYKEITIKKIVQRGVSTYAVVTTEDEYYEVDFELSAIIDVGGEYNATISHPILNEPKILKVDPKIRTCPTCQTCKGGGAIIESGSSPIYPDGGCPSSVG